MNAHELFKYAIKIFLLLHFLVRIYLMTLLLYSAMLKVLILFHIDFLEAAENKGESFILYYSMKGTSLRFLRNYVILFSQFLFIS